MIANLAEICKADAAGVLTHFFDQVGKGNHEIRVSLLISLIKGGIARTTVSLQGPAR